jgi:hypothetical protein
VHDALLRSWFQLYLLNGGTRSSFDRNPTKQNLTKRTQIDRRRPGGLAGSSEMREIEVYGTSSRSALKAVASAPGRIRRH